MPVVYSKLQNQQPQQQNNPILGGIIPATGGVLGGIGGGILGAGLGPVGAGAGAIGGAGAGAGAGVALEQSLMNLLGRGQSPQANLRRQGSEIATSAAAEGIGLGAGALLSPITRPLGRGILKLSPFFRESGEQGARAVSRSVAREIPELQGVIGQGGGEISEEILSRSGSQFAPKGAFNELLGRLGITTGRGLAKRSAQETTERVGGSLANQVKNEVSNLSGKPTRSLLDIMSESADNLIQKRGKDEAVLSALDELLEESNIQKAVDNPTWEGFNQVKQSLDNVVKGKGSDQLQAINTLLRKEIADKVRIEMAKESPTLAKLLADESLQFRVGNQAERTLSASELPSSLFDVQKILRPELVQPVARATRAIPSAVKNFSRTGGKALLSEELGGQPPPETIPTGAAAPSGVAEQPGAGAGTQQQPPASALEQILTPENLMLGVISGDLSAAEANFLLKLVEKEEVPQEVLSLERNVDTMERLLDDIPQTRGASLASVATSRIPFVQEDIRLLRDLQSAFSGQVARVISSEVGVLTDRDIKRASDILPKLTDSAQQRQRKVELIREALGNLKSGQPVSDEGRQYIESQQQTPTLNGLLQ